VHCRTEKRQDREGKTSAPRRSLHARNLSGGKGNHVLLETRKHAKTLNSTTKGRWCKEGTLKKNPSFENEMRENREINLLSMK